MRTNVEIGAYYLRPYAQTESHVRDVKECGIDFISEISQNSTNAFDLLHKYGLKAIALGPMPERCASGQKRELQPPEMILRCAGKIGNHPAILMTDLADEPSALDFPYYGEIVRLVGEVRPDARLYMNLYPNYASVAKNSDSEARSQLGARTYSDYLESYASNMPLDYLSFDYYVYSAPTNAPESLIPGMFENLRNAAEVCRRTGRDLWFIPQVNSIHPSLWLSENMLRYQAFTAMSFGAEVINWACYTAGWWTNQVLDAAGEKTEQYEKLRRVNSEIKTMGGYYMRFRPLDTVFVGFSGSASDWLRGVKAESRVSFSDGFFMDVRASDGSPLVIGTRRSRDPASNDRALFITAVDDPLDRNPRTFEVTFRTHYNVKAVGPRGPVSVDVDEDGVCHVILQSNSAVLICGRLKK